VIRPVAWFAVGSVAIGCASNDTNTGDDADDTDDTEDTETTGEPSTPGGLETTSMSVDVTADNGVAPYRLDFDFVYAGWPETSWGFYGGNQPSTSLGFFFDGDPSVSTYTIATDDGPNYGVFTDPDAFGSAGNFNSQSGTLEVTRWDAVPNAPGTYVMDGTFALHVSNEYPGNLVEADLEGTFANVSVTEGSAFR
jgi:hypothetical protein